jgi:hypothetical protein
VGSFDELVMIDWSAASVPRTGRDSIWVAHGTVSAGDAMAVANPPTRAAAFDIVAEVLERAVDAGRSVLVGVDFSLGYPAGFAECTAALRRSDAAVPAWRATWGLLAALVVDGPDNVNNRFECADRINRRSGTAIFWGRPTGGRHDALRWLPPRRVTPPGLRANPCPPLRATERAAGGGIRSNFQLFGGVTVGGQVLTGVPWVSRLVARLGELVAVWPFETGFLDDPLATGCRIVLAESWPTAFGPVSPPPSGVRDESQVRLVVDAWRQAAADGWPGWFDPPGAASADTRGISTGQPDDPRTATDLVLAEEGWILGVGRR